MAINPADQAVRLAITDILSKFVSKNELDDGPLATLREQINQKYQPNRVEVHNLIHLLGGNSDLDLRDQHRFLILEPVIDRMIPLLTLQTSHDWVHFRAYVLLTMLDQCNALKALAIRFETDEGERQTDGTIGSHDFCHAQLCQHIGGMRGIGMMSATTPSWLPESQPSFPLDAQDQVGLVLCMLTALYGGRHVVQRLNTPRDRDLRKYLNQVRALMDEDARSASASKPRS